MTKLQLPKKFLSYSAIQLWNTSKDQFRKRYYENIKFADTKYTLFGKAIEKEIYAGKYPDIPCWGGAQHELKTTIEDIPIIGYLDSFNFEDKQFLDYKTSLEPWTLTKVQKLDQLPFYSMLVEKIYGKVHPVCKLIWLETQVVAEKGLLTHSDKMIYTGKHEIFERNIKKWERRRIIDWITVSAEEISQDYCEYLESWAHSA